MKKVIVLIDDENKKSNYIQNIGNNDHIWLFCRIPTVVELEQTKIYHYKFIIIAF
jgi:hypothetical protein